MNRNLLKLALMSVTLSAGSAFADPPPEAPKTEAGERWHKRHRQAREHARIRNGVKTGELTKDEAKALRREQRRIAREKRKALSDGKLSGDEVKDIQQKQNEASKNIAGEKHDGEKRGQ